MVKHEALAVRRGRIEAVPVEEVDSDRQAAEAQRPVDDLLAGRERVKRSAEALRRLKPDEVKALMLKAQGLSYAEIGESLGWTYTNDNVGVRLAKAFSAGQEGGTERRSCAFAAPERSFADRACTDSRLVAPPESRASLPDGPTASQPGANARNSNA